MHFELCELCVFDKCCTMLRQRDKYGLAFFGDCEGDANVVAMIQYLHSCSPANDDQPVK